MRTLLFVAAVVACQAIPVRGQLLSDIVDSRATLGEPVRFTAGKKAAVTATSRPVFAAFTGLAVEIVSDADELNGRVRIGDEGAWSDWIELYFVRSATGGFFVAGFHGTDVFSSARFQLEIAGPSDTPIIFGNAGVFDNRLDEDRMPLKAPSVGERMVPETGKSADDPIITPPALITRAEWGAEPFRDGSPVPLANPSYNYMTFHHAAGYSATTYEEGLQQLKAIQDLHQNVRGWSDIGYQFVIDRSGRVYQGRPFLDGSTTLAQEPILARGAHVGGHNTGNIGICMLGCYHPPEGSYCAEVPTEESLASFVTMFAFFSSRYGPPVENLFGHRDWSSTACPGDNNYALLPTVRSDVAMTVITGNQAVAAATLEATTDESGVVHVSWEFLEDYGVESYRLERSYGESTEIVHVGFGAESTSFADDTIADAERATYTLYASAADGRTQRLGEADVALDLPEGFSLSEPFPNPMRSSSSLRFFLPYNAFVKLTLYDSAGREVRRLEDAFFKGDRWYVSRLSADDLSSGLYFARLRVDGFSGIAFDETRAVALVR